MARGNNEHNKVKVAMLKSMMGDPKLAKIISESVKSPIGSTKRAQAKSVVSILKKINRQGPDGMGGSGFSQPIAQQPTTVPSYSNNYSNNMVIFPAAPKFKVKPTGSNNGPSMGNKDGMGGPGDVDTNIFTPVPKTNTSATRPMASIGTPSITYPALSGIGNYANPFQTSDKPVVSPFTSTQSNPYMSVAPKINTGTLGTPSSSIGDFVSNFGNSSRMTPQDNTQWNTSVQEPNASMAPTGAQTPTDTSSGVTTPPVGGQTPGQITPASDVKTPVYTPPSGSTQTGSQTQNQGTVKTQTSPSSYGNVSSAVANNTGPGAFAINTMGDMEALKKMFPGVPEDQLPIGASLSKTVDALDVALKKEYNVDTLGNQLNNLLRTGATLKDDLTNYIRGKDDYVSYVDGLIDRTKSDMFKRSDMADPRVQNSMTQYMNYLYTLKGRQNQRYVDFLNSAVNQYNGNLTNLQNSYNTASTMYQNALTRKSGIAQAEYTNIYNALSDMYTQAADAPKKEIELQYLREQLLNAQLNNVKLTKDAFGGTGDTQYIEEINKYKDYIYDKDGNLKPDVNLTSWVNDLANQGYSPKGVAVAFQNGMMNKLNAVQGAEAVNAARQYKNQITELAANGGGATAESMGNAVISKAGDALSKYVLENMNNIRYAVSDLAPKSMFGKSKGMPSKDQYIRDHEKDVDKEILGDLYDYAQRETAANPSLDPEFIFSNGKIKGSTDQEIANKIVAGITEGWKYEIARSALQ